MDVKGVQWPSRRLKKEGINSVDLKKNTNKGLRMQHYRTKKDNEAVNT